MKAKLKYLSTGLATFIPGLARFSGRGTGGTDSARYCYSVWLRHLVSASLQGLSTDPAVVAELGPGDSLGMGLAALLTGATKYYAFDVVAHANPEMNLRVLDELVQLFKERQDIPGDDEFPIVKPYLDSYIFPADILLTDRLDAALDEARIAKIRADIENPVGSESMIEYRAPWFDADIVEQETVDLIYSQTVLECVDNLRQAYQLMWAWLKPGAFMSHQIDFKSIGTADEWNGHWTYSDFLWTLIKGRRPYLINREPHFTHIGMMEQIGFKIVNDKKVRTASRITRDQLAKRYRHIPEEDLTTSGAFILAVKPA